MTDSYIQMPPDGSGKKQRTQSRTVGSDTVHETYVINTDATTGNSARVLNGVPAATDYGLVVRRVDPARTSKVIYVAAASLAGATSAAEAMLTTTPVTGFVSGSAVSTGHAVTAAKTFRVQQITGNVRMSTAAAHIGAIRIRVNTGGAVTATSPAIFVVTLPGVAALANTGFPFSAALPEGFDIPASAGADVRVGVSGWSTLAGTLVDLSIVGYEY